MTDAVGDLAARCPLRPRKFRKISWSIWAGPENPEFIAQTFTDFLNFRDGGLRKRRGGL